jgi:cell division protein FtsB
MQQKIDSFLWKKKAVRPKQQWMRLTYVTAVAFALVAGSSSVYAQQTDNQQTEDKQALTERLEQLERAVTAIEQQLTALKGSVATQAAPASETEAPAAAAASA